MNELTLQDTSSLLKNHFWRLESHILGISLNQESLGYKDLPSHGTTQNSFFNNLLEGITGKKAVDSEATTVKN